MVREINLSINLNEEMIYLLGEPGRVRQGKIIFLPHPPIRRLRCAVGDCNVCCSI